MGSADKEMTVTEVLNFLHDVIRLQKSASLNGQVSAEECPPPPPVRFLRVLLGFEALQ